MALWRSVGEYEHVLVEGEEGGGSLRRPNDFSAMRFATFRKDTCSYKC